jgi:hypothetical protein
VERNLTALASSASNARPGSRRPRLRARRHDPLFGQVGQRHPWSAWGHNLHPIPAGRVGQALVISDQRRKVGSEGTSGGEMDRIRERSSGGRRMPASSLRVWSAAMYLTLSCTSGSTARHSVATRLASGGAATTSTTAGGTEFESWSASLDEIRTRLLEVGDLRDSWCGVLVRR